MKARLALKSILKGLGVTLALSVNYSCGLILIFIWKLEISYLLFFTFISSFFAGMLIKNMARSLLCGLIAIFLSIWISVGLLSAPSLVAYGIFIFGPYIEAVLQRVLFMLFASLSGTLMGSLLIDYFS
ncbi:MAG: hypothetical protein QXX08_05975 [Candidatus Bathyarchaeia archaeon]